MRLFKLTDGDDWNVRTLLDMACRRECWHAGGLRPDEKWRWGMNYTWYDGPMWHFFFGRWWIAIAF